MGFVTRETRVVSGPTYLSVAREHINHGGPAVLFVHATGFCKETWRPVRDELAATGVGVDFVAMDQRGHGASGPLPHPADWWQLGKDVLRVTAGRTDVIGVGHSSGGAALALAEILAPGTFRSLVLIEPIIVPPPFKRIEDHPLAIGALKRTENFVNRQAAEANFRERGPFQGWDERAFQGYLDGGLVADESGESVRLACAPGDEAEFYRSANNHRGWSRLHEISAPVEIIAGELSDSHTPRFLGLLVGRMGQATVTWVPEANHFVCMQRPGVVAAAVEGAVSGEWVPPQRR